MIKAVVTTDCVKILGVYCEELLVSLLCSCLSGGSLIVFHTLRHLWLWLRVGALFCLVVMPSYATSENPLAPVNNLSPRQTYESLLAGVERLEDLYQAYSRDKTYATLSEIRYHFKRLRDLLDLENIPPANRVKAGNAAITYLADIVSRLPPLDVNSIPDVGPGGVLPDRWTLPGTDIQLTRIEHGPDTGEYLVTSQSIEQLPEYFQRIKDYPLTLPRSYQWLRNEHVNATGPFIPASLTRWIPEPLKDTYLNTPIWKILAITLVVGCVGGIAYAWARCVRQHLVRGSTVNRLFWRFSIPAVFLLLYFLSVWFVIDHINPSGLFAVGEGLLATAVLYALVAWLVWTGCFLLVEAVLTSPRVPSNSFDAHLLRLSARIAAIASTGGILLYGANEMGIPALGLAAGVGVGGFALALASQSTIENLFGGLSLFADRPFRIGDVIRFGNDHGTVEMVGTRSSRVRALDGTLVTIPNSDLAQMQIMNLTRRSKCLFNHTLSLSVATSVKELSDLLDDIRAVMTAHDQVEKNKGWPRVRCSGIEVGRIQIEMRAYVLTDDYTYFMEVQEALLLQVLRCIEDRGVQLAPPMAVVQAH